MHTSAPRGTTLKPVNKLRTSFLLLAAATLAAMMLAQACAGSSTPDAGTAAATIDQKGGTATNDQGVIIFVPAGAIAPGDQVTFTIDASTAPAPGGVTPVGA